VALLALLLVAGAHGSAGERSSRASRPARPEPPSGRPATRWPIRHVVYIVKENRTFDQYFGLFPGADGATRGRTRTGWRPLRRGIPDVLPHDLQHNQVAATLAYDGGRMDGFAHDVWSRRYAYSEAVPKDIPMYWQWAKHFVLADRFFSSERGPSFPNHLFSIAASSAGTTENPKRVGLTGAQWTWGCDAPAFTEVQVRGPTGAVTSTRPCFDLPTLGDRLNQKGVSWAYYAATIHEAGYIWSAYDAIDHVRTSAQWSRHVRPVDRLVTDIRRGRLPAVTWVTPRFELSEHPDFSLCHGENWTTRVVDAVMDGPMWKHTAVFITWDDWGGFYDHVPPPRVAGQDLGFRVPLLVLSPFARAGYIDHRPSDFTAVLRFVEDNWGLAPLTPRDRAQSDLAQDFDFSQHPRPPDPQPQRAHCTGPALTLPPRTQR
jgi:phospholipase C